MRDLEKIISVPCKIQNRNHYCPHNFLKTNYHRFKNTGKIIEIKSISVTSRGVEGQHRIERDMRELLGVIKMFYIMIVLVVI